MTKYLIGIILAFSIAFSAAAGDQVTALRTIQQEWARIKYQTPDENTQEEQIKALSAAAALAVEHHQGEADYLIWHAIVLATQAGMDGGLGALGKVKRARKLLERAEKIDSAALGGSIPTSLGSLYYQVPGWPLGFGSKKKARKYLLKGLSINPAGLDTNFFYGDFLFERGEFNRARAVLSKALEAADRPNRPIADAGRREEIRVLLSKIAKKTGANSR
ncbi:MAG: hypothetical protein JKY60_13100 [Kordiimonadaceae bacterium]|nr:hypothetical protein [Kordiimonadaceae bacterium]